MTRHIESRTQQGCVKWFRLQYPQYERLLFAVPNGGARDRVTGAIMKAEGVVAGVADLILFLPSGDSHALCIEMKTDSGRQSPAQKRWMEDVRRQGYRYEVCRDLDSFIKIVDDYINHNDGKGISNCGGDGCHACGRDTR